jgi:hypothetical protein
MSVLLTSLLAQALIHGQPKPTESNDQIARYGFVLAASVHAIGFSSGVALIGSDDAGGARARTGWLMLGAGFVASPLLGNALSQSWTRGVLFSLVPAVCLAGSAVVLSRRTSGIDQMPLAQDQRVLWAFTSVGLAASVVALVDLAVQTPRPSPSRASALRVVPATTPQSLGLFASGQF